MAFLNRPAHNHSFNQNPPVLPYFNQSKQDKVFINHRPPTHTPHIHTFLQDLVPLPELLLTLFFDLLSYYLPLTLHSSHPESLALPWKCNHLRAFLKAVSSPRNVLSWLTPLDLLKFNEFSRPTVNILLKFANYSLLELSTPLIMAIFKKFILQHVSPSNAI